MDGILKCSFSNLVPWGTNKTEAFYSRPRPRFEAKAETVKIVPRGKAVPRGTTSLQQSYLFGTKRHGNIPMCKGCVECRWCVKNCYFSTSISLHRVLSTLRPSFSWVVVTPVIPPSPLAYLAFPLPPLALLHCLFLSLPSRSRLQLGDLRSVLATQRVRREPGRQTNIVNLEHSFIHIRLMYKLT